MRRDPKKMKELATQLFGGKSFRVWWGDMSRRGVRFFGMFKVNEEARMTREEKVRSKGSWGTDHVGSCQLQKGPWRGQ